jgi:hypothetical protein
VLSAAYFSAASRIGLSAHAFEHPLLVEAPLPTPLTFDSANEPLEPS